MKIWLVTNRLLCPGNFLNTVAEAARAGLAAIILREKDLPPREYYRLALKVNEIAGAYGAKLIVNGSVEVACAAGAAGVHLGREALPLPLVRRRLGYRGLAGVSVHSVAGCRAALRAGADYLLFGHVFASRSKPGLAPRGTAPLAEALSFCTVPLVALGGINPDNVRQVLDLGIEHVAVMSYIMQSGDPYGAVRELRRKGGIGAVDDPAERRNGPWI